MLARTVVGMGKRLDALVASGLPDVMTLTPFDGADVARQRDAQRQILLIAEQRKTNELLQALVDLERARLDLQRPR